MAAAERGPTEIGVYDYVYERMKSQGSVGSTVPVDRWSFENMETFNRAVGDNRPYQAIRSKA